MAHNSTIINRKKNLGCGHYDFNFSKSRCKQCATVDSTAKRVAAFEGAEEDESFWNLVDDLDAIFSRFIRLKYADEKGFVECYCCGKKRLIGEMHNGHFIHRTDMATRFLEANCRPQCPLCNSKHNDDPSIFANRLEAEEKGITAWLLAQSREIVKPTRDELKQLIINYRFKVKILEKKIQSPLKQAPMSKTILAAPSGDNPPTVPPPIPPKPPIQS